MAAPMLLVINPGSTSTKVAVFEGERLLAERTVRHAPEDFAGCAGVLDQKEARTRRLFDFLREAQIDPASLSAAVGRGGLLGPVISGTYIVGEAMLRDLGRDAAGRHASSLGAIMAAEIAGRYSIPAYIVDPVVVDELAPVARISGIPGISRRSVFHALNAKAVAREAAQQLGIRYEEARFVVAHMGGGISIGAHRLGRVVDVNDALNGEGPFSPERCGSVPLAQLIEGCFSGRLTQAEWMHLLHKNGGMRAYLQTNDMLEAERRIAEGDAEAKLIVEAMAYQVAKEIGAMAVALEGPTDAIVLTGGLAQSERFVSMISRRVGFIAPIILRPGEEEMRALALGALRVLTGEAEAMEYPEGGNAGCGMPAHMDTQSNGAFGRRKGQVANIVTIDTQACKGCALCVAACPKGIIRMEESARNAKGYHPAQVFEMERCIACAMCAIICPDSAITVEKGDN